MTASPTESALCAYLRDTLTGLAIYPGHTNETMRENPRVVIAATMAGGALQQGAGVDELDVEVQILTQGGEMGDPSPMDTLNRIARVIIEHLHYENLSDIKAAATALGVCGIEGIEYTGFREGRNEESAMHGVLLTYKVWSRLT